jgi:hypothetical protein
VILQVPPDAPLVVKIAADAILLSHIGGAAAGIVSGFIAIFASKGGRVHRAAGNIFFVSMLMMSGVGAVVAPFLGDLVSMTAGAITFYLTATAWATVMRAPDRIGVFEPVAATFAGGIVVIGVAVGMMGAAATAGMSGSLSKVAFIFAFFAAVSLLCDWGMLRAGGIGGRRRIARHAWRMGTALVVAAGSFAGQPKAIPEFVHVSPMLLMIPMAAAVALTLFWLILASFTRSFGPPEGPAYSLARLRPAT